MRIECDDSALCGIDGDEVSSALRVGETSMAVLRRNRKPVSPPVGSGNTTSCWLSLCPTVESDLLIVTYEVEAGT